MTEAQFVIFFTRSKEIEIAGLWFFVTLGAGKGLEALNTSAQGRTLGVHTNHHSKCWKHATLFRAFSTP